MDETVLGYKTSNLNKNKRIMSEVDAISTLIDLKKKGKSWEVGSDLEKDIGRFVGKDVTNVDVALDILKDKEDKRKTEYVDKEIEERSKILAKGKGVEAQKRIRLELENIVGQKKFWSSDEESLALARAIYGSNDVNIETKVIAKEAKLALDKWQENEIENVRGYRREKFKQIFEEKVRENNPGITDKQLALVRKKADLIAEVYFSDGGIENQKDKALESNQKESIGKLESSWSGLEGFTGFLRKTPAEVKEILSKNKAIDADLEGVNLPYGDFANARSFDTITSSFGDANTFAMFRSIQNGVSFFGRSMSFISKYTGGWWEKGITSVVNHFASKIGNQAIQSFIKSSMSTLVQNGLKGGMDVIMKGLLSGGAKAAAGGALAATGATVGAATGPVGWIVTAALAAKKLLEKIADKLGINFTEKLKEALAITGNKGFDFMIRVALSIVGIPALIAGITFGGVGIILAVVGGLFGGSLIQHNQLISGLVPDLEINEKNAVEPYINDMSKVDTQDSDEILCNLDLKEYENELSKAVKTAGGDYSRYGVAAAAQYLANFSAEHYRIPYFWAGNYGKGMNTEWGCSKFDSHTGITKPYGMDCTGFVKWAYSQAGFSGSTSILYKKANIIPFGEENCDLVRRVVKPGDLVRNPGEHLAIIIGVDESNRRLKIAQEGGYGGKGLNVCFLNMCDGSGCGSFKDFYSMDGFFSDYSSGTTKNNVNFIDE